VLACPLTDETRGLIDADALAALSEDAPYSPTSPAAASSINLRSSTHSKEAGELGGAALDVFEEEPLPEESPLWDRDDVLVTPHMAGSTPTTGERCADVFLRNYDRFREGGTSRTASSDSDSDSVDPELRFSARAAVARP